MRTSVIDILAPHYCCCCGDIGALLCESCKYDITSEPFEACILCHGLARANENICNQCASRIPHGWCVGGRAGGLKEMVDRYKFERARAAYKPLAALLHITLPSLPADIIVVPVPTINAHIRTRGYDHTALIARQFASLRTLPYRPCITRATQTVQRNATKSVRMDQAKEAFAAKPCDGGRYLLIDDVCTTGATLEYARQALIAAGANEVWVAVIASQPLDKTTNI